MTAASIWLAASQVRASRDTPSDSLWSLRTTFAHSDLLLDRHSLPAYHLPHGALRGNRNLCFHVHFVRGACASWFLADIKSSNVWALIQGHPTHAHPSLPSPRTPLTHHPTHAPSLPSPRTPLTHRPTHAPHPVLLVGSSHTSHFASVDRHLR